jgi:hypothetical protein
MRTLRPNGEVTVERNTKLSKIFAIARGGRS